MIVIAGCQENVASPTAVAVAPATMSLAPQGRPNLELSYDNASQNGNADFTVGPNGGVFKIGNHAVYFPAKSICDPATSSYGQAAWDQSCTALRGSLRIHAVSRTVNGTPAVDFSPSLRFVPSSNPARWVWLYMSVPGASSTDALSKHNILYAPVMGGTAYDETITDPTLRTYVGNGVALRRIKHFSGYTIGMGATEEENGGVAPLLSTP
jgi:hypothetical protein